jgi:hypothetical protein
MEESNLKETISEDSKRFVGSGERARGFKRQHGLLAWVKRLSIICNPRVSLKVACIICSCPGEATHLVDLGHRPLMLNAYSSGCSAAALGHSLERLGRRTGLFVCFIKTLFACIQTLHHYAVQQVDEPAGPPRLLLRFGDPTLDVLSLLPAVLLPFTTRVLIPSSGLQFLTFIDQDTMQAARKFLKDHHGGSGATVSAWRRYI